MPNPEVAQGAPYRLGRTLGKQRSIQDQHFVVGIQISSPVMAAHQQGQSRIAELTHDPQQIGARWGINRSAGLIEEQQLGWLQQRAREQRPLLLTAGEFIQPS